MKFIQFLLATFLLCIGLFLSYDKVEIINEDIKKVEQGTVPSEGLSQVSTYNETELSREAQRPVSIETDDETQVSSENNITQTKNNVKKKSTKKESKRTTTKKETKNDNIKPKETTVKEEVKEEPKIEETKPKDSPKPKEDPKPQCSDLYESITHGKVDKSSKSSCVSYGNKIQNNELDEVLDYNEEHGNVKKPTISYFRCYEVVDKNCNTKGWYLHFFCSSGECSDSILKSLYG